MTTARIAVLGRQDLNNWDGTNQKTFSRKSTLGGMDVLTKIGYEVDVLAVFGNGDEYNDSTISKAISRIGTSVARCLVLNPGTWTISNNLTITSNLTLKCPPGCTISVASGVTLTIQGPIEAGPYQIFSGSGTVTISGVQIIHDQWADGSGYAYLPSVDNQIDLGSSTYEFKDGYFDGTVYADAANIDSATITDAAISGTINGSGSITALYIKVLDENGTTVHQAPMEMIMSSAAEVQFI